MDRVKMLQQAKILRDKKMMRMAQVARNLRPKVENGVVKYDRPQPSTEVQKFSAPGAAKVVRSVLPQATIMSAPKEVKQPLNAQTNIRPAPGCNSCRRKNGTKQ